MAAVLTRLLFGSLPDRVGRRRAAIGSYVYFAAMVLAMVELTPDRLLCSASCSAARTASSIRRSARRAWSKPARAERGRVMTLVMGAFRLGNVGSALVLGTVAELYGFRTVFMLAALGCAAGVAALYWTGPDSGSEFWRHDAAIACPARRFRIRSRRVRLDGG